MSIGTILLSSICVLHVYYKSIVVNSGKPSSHELYISYSTLCSRYALGFLIMLLAAQEDLLFFHLVPNSELHVICYIRNELLHGDHYASQLHFSLPLMSVLQCHSFPTEQYSTVIISVCSLGSRAIFCSLHLPPILDSL